MKKAKKQLNLLKISTKFMTNNTVENQQPANTTLNSALRVLFCCAASRGGWCVRGRGGR